MKFEKSFEVVGPNHHPSRLFICHYFPRTAQETCGGRELRTSDLDVFSALLP